MRANISRKNIKSFLKICKEEGKGKGKRDKGKGKNVLDCKSVLGCASGIWKWINHNKSAGLMLRCIEI